MKSIVMSFFAFIFSSSLLMADIGLVSSTRTTIELKGSWQAAWSVTESIKAPIAGAKWEPVAVPDRRSFIWSPPPEQKSLWYRLSFTGPSRNGKKAYLYFNRVGFQCRVWLNGKEVGNHIGVQTPFSIDVTDVLKERGENNLLVGTNRSAMAERGEYSNLPKTWSPVTAGMAAEKPTDKAAWPSGHGYWPAGICQPVQLILTSPVFIEDVFIKTSVRNKEIEVQVEFQNPAGQEKTYQVKIMILDQGQSVKELPLHEIKFAKADKNPVITVKDKWLNPVLWNPDSPHLYQCLVQLVEGSTLVDEARDQFGFREVWSKGTRLFLNGLPFSIRSDTTHAGLMVGSREEYRGHIQKIKRIRNVNALTIKVQTPNDRDFWDVCDEEGMLLVDQTDVSDQYCGSTSRWDCAKAFVVELTRTIRNHPSFIIQQMGNENTYSYRPAGVPFAVVPWTPHMIAVKEAAMAVDPTRLRTVGGGDMDQGGKSDFMDFHGGPTPHWHEMFPNLHIVTPKMVQGKGQKPVFFSEWNEGIGITMCGILGDEFYRANPTDTGARSPRSAYRQVRQAQGASLAVGAAEFRKQGIAAYNMFCMDHLYNQDTNAVDGTRNLVKWTNNCRPVVVLPKSYSNRHWAGQVIKREFIISNDAFEPLNGTLAWRLFDEKNNFITEDSLPVQLEVGGQKTIVIEIPAPAFSGSTGRFTLNYQIIQSDDLLYEDTLPLAVFCRPDFSKLPEFVILDPAGRTGQLLTKAGVKLKTISEPGQAGNNPLIIAASAKLDDIGWKAIETLVKQGNRVLVLHRPDWPKQVCEVKTQNSEETNIYGVPYVSSKGEPGFLKIQCGFANTYGFIRSPNHPVVTDLTEEDLRCWAGEKNFTMPIIAESIRWPSQNVISLDNLRKPDGNGLFRSLIDAGYQNGMDISLLTEIPAGKGRALTTSLLLAEKAQDDPAAERLLYNVLKYLSEVKPRTPKSILALSPMPELETRAFPIQKQAALNNNSVGAVVFDARRVKWDDLKKQKTDIQLFVQNGGTLYIHRLSPETAKELNAIFDLKITCAPPPAPAQFWLDAGKMAFPIKGHTLTAGIGNYDLNWTVFQDIWQHIVQMPDPLIEYSATSAAPGAEELTQSVAPACVLLRIPMEKGQVVIDQVLWDLNPETREYIAKIDAGHGPDPGRLKDVKTSNDLNQRKARRYIATLMTNILDVDLH